MKNLDIEKHKNSIVHQETVIAIETRNFNTDWKEVEQFNDMPHAIKRLKYLQAKERVEPLPAAYRIVSSVRRIHSF